MKFKLQNLSSEDIKDVLELYSDNILSKPIMENNKHFEKYTKGFRLNKLHRYILDKIYCDEIQKDDESKLGNYLIYLLKNTFSGTKIVELVEKADNCDVLETAIELQKEIFVAKLTIFPTHIFMLADIEVDERIKKVIINYNHFFIDEKVRINEECEKRISAIYEEKNEKLRIQCEKCSSELTIEKNKSKVLDRLAKQKDSNIDSINKENSLLIDKLNQTNAEVKIYKTKLCDYDAQIKLNSKLQEINKELKKQIENLEGDCDKLKESFLSPEIVRSMCDEVLDDLRSKGIEEKVLIEKANNIFSENETLSTSWEKLSIDEIDKLGEITRKMGNNYIENDDIELLDEIENNIQYKYMLIKGLKVVFYKYLENEIAKGTIDQMFSMS